MLVELSIKNVAVIEHIRIDCGRGFHVLTGETGAGKSMIVDALTLIAGGRGSSDLIRYGTERAEVEAVFEMPAEHYVWHLLERFGIHYNHEESLIIRRELTSAGKSMSRVNGQSVNLSTLREISEQLVNIHGQHEHQSLFKAELHIDWLDTFGKTTIAPTKALYQELFARYKHVQQQLQQLADEERNVLQMLDLYRFQAEEIRAATLQTNEEELLLAERKRLANAEKLAYAANAAYDTLSGPQRATELLHAALQHLKDIAKFDGESLHAVNEQLENAYFQTEDVAYQLRDYREKIEFNPTRLEEVETRLSVINQLKKKYGGDVAAIIAHGQEMARKIDDIEHHSERLQQLQAHQQELQTQVAEHARILTEHRARIADQLTAQIVAQLCALQMERTRFVVQMEPLADFSQKGRDRVEFLISVNPGEPLRSLAKVASGGECSRIMLALKTIFAEIEQIPVLVFDEVDTGVSGRAAQAIAAKLHEVARYCQVFAITHLPQVACMANRHYLIDKQVREQRTVTSLTPISDEARVEELARMVGGAIVTDTTRQHAREMLQFAQTNIITS